jgi:DNA polymerase III subunit gamma/tau
MSYIVLARKWRPQIFNEIIGQEHISTTLQNAIKQDRVAHAYIFCGPRGIGKTTAARVFAKALNCEKGPKQNPCNRCASCKDITAARSIDVIEIDGASNRGIDEIRNLKENIKFSPQKSRFKIYIIDEVHMLTPEAFNALLKTLEEPPSHVKFIFATTAPHKVISTILSRCQRFDFRRLQSQDIAKKLKDICKAENIVIDETALFNIVRQASGSLRDAESLLDQLATYCRSKISAEDTYNMLGIIEYERLYQYAQHIINKDAAEAIRFINNINDEGIDLNQFITSLMEYFRNVMLIKEGPALFRMIELPEEEIKRISIQAKSLTREDILYVLYNLVNSSNSMRLFSSPKIALELLSVKLSQKESIVSVNEILSRLSSMEKGKLGIVTKSVKQQQEKTADAPQDKPRQEPRQGPKQGSTQEPTQELNQTETSSPVPGSRPDLYPIREALAQVIKNIKQEKIYIASCLEEGNLLDCRSNTIVFGFSKSNIFHKESLEKPQNRELIECHFSKALGKKMKVDFIIQNSQTEESDARTGKSKTPKPSLNPLKKALSDPIIKSALDIFDGNIIKFM